MSDKKGFFEAIGPGKSFGVGFVLALLLFFAIGFFVLLAKGADFGTKKTTTFGSGAGTPTTTGTQPSAAGQPAAITMAEITDEDHVLGDLESAEVVLVEYSDLDCPFCQRFHPTVTQLKQQYGDDLAIVYRHFPLDSLHPNARAKAEYTECIAAEGGDEAFWNTLEILFDGTRTITPAQMGDVATEVGVDAAAVEECFSAGEYKSTVQAMYQDAVSAGGQGTPYTIVVSRDGAKTPVSGAVPIDRLQAVIDPILQ